MADKLQLEQSTDRVLLEDGSGQLLLEVSLDPDPALGDPRRLRLNRMRLTS